MYNRTTTAIANTTIQSRYVFQKLIFECYESPKIVNILGFGNPSNDRDMTRPPSSTFPISTTIINQPPTTVFTNEPSTTNQNTFFSTTPLAVDGTQQTMFSNTRPPSEQPDTSLIPGSTTIDSTAPMDNDKNGRFPTTTTRYPINRYPTTSRYPSQTDRTNPPDNILPSTYRPTTERLPAREGYPTTFPNRFDTNTRYPPKDRYPEKYPERKDPYDFNKDQGYTPLDRPIDRPIDRPTYIDRDPLNDRYPEYPIYDYPNYYNDKPASQPSYPNTYPNANGHQYPPYHNNNYAPSSSQNGQNYYFWYGNGDRYGQGSSGGGGSSTSNGGNINGGQGNGYDNLGNGFINRPSYNTPVTLPPPPNQPQYNDGSNNNRPSSSSSSSSSTSSSSSSNGDYYGQRPTNSLNNNGYGPRPEKPDVNGQHQKPSSSNSANGGYATSTANHTNTNTQSSSNGSGYDSLRPDPPTGGNYSPRPDKPTIKPGSGGGGYLGTNNYHVTEEPIEIYFNPESYYQTKRKLILLLLHHFWI